MTAHTEDSLVTISSCEMWLMLLILVQVWSLLMEETERLIDLMRTSTDRLAVSILEAVTQIITEKKLVRKLYAEKRNNMDMELDRVRSIMILFVYLMPVNSMSFLNLLVMMCQY